jgi:hypothetical protein
VKSSAIAPFANSAKDGAPDSSGTPRNTVFDCAEKSLRRTRLYNEASLIQQLLRMG